MPSRLPPQPDPAPKCPECADFLRLKQLVSVKFTRLPAEETVCAPFPTRVWLRRVMYMSLAG